MNPSPAIPLPGLGADPTRPAWRSLPREHRLWLLTWGVVMALLAARVPNARAGIAERVDALVASGALPQTDQQDLALNLGLAVSLLFSALVPFIALAVARRLQPRLRLPVVTLRGRALPGALVAVGPVLVVKQAVPLLTGSLAPRADPVFWLATALVLGLSVWAVARRAPAGSAARVAVLSALAGLLAAAL